MGYFRVDDFLLSASSDHYRDQLQAQTKMSVRMTALKVAFIGRHSPVGRLVAVEKVDR